MAESSVSLSGSTTSSEDDPPSGSTRQRLLEVAAELFAEHGYHGASLADMAKRLGIRKPSLYNHIASKDELFMELLKRSVEAWQTAGELPLRGEGTHRQRLRRHLQTTVDFAVDSPHATALCRLAVSQVSGDLAERASAYLMRHREDYQRHMERFFASAIAAGEVVPQVPGTYGNEVPGTCGGEVQGEENEVPGTCGKVPESEVPGTCGEEISEVPGTCGGRQGPTPEVLTFSWLTFLDGILMHQVFSLGSRREAYLLRLEELWVLFWRGLSTVEEATDE